MGTLDNNLPSQLLICDFIVFGFYTSAKVRFPIRKVIPPRILDCMDTLAITLGLFKISYDGCICKRIQIGWKDFVKYDAYNLTEAP